MRRIRGAELLGSGRGAQDEGFDHFLALRASVDDFSFDVGAVQQPHINRVPLGRFGMEIAHVRGALQDKRIGGGFHVTNYGTMPQLIPVRVLILALGFPLYALEVIANWVWNGMKDAV